MADRPTDAPGDLRLDSTAGRGVLVAAVLASGMAFLDSTVVTVALPHLGAELDSSMAGLQWTVNAFLLTLASFVLLGGALGDRYGRRRIFVLGLIGFTGASLLCGLAQNVPLLVAARGLQGLAAALLVPGSLALLQASFHREERARAIGAWSGLAGVSTAIGPFAGGWLIDSLSWRWIFFLNLPLAAVALLACVRWVPESRDPSAAGRRFDVAGAVLGAVGLGGLTYALIEIPERGWTAWPVLASTVVGLLAVAGFVRVERARGEAAMLPPALFAVPSFTPLNLYTVVVYAALSGFFFFVTVHLQAVVGYSALAAGAAGIPVTLLMLVGSARAGALANRIGPRLPLTVGPLLGVVGVLLLRRVEPGASFWWEVLPAMTIFGIGLTLIVAPLTAAVLACVPDRFAGVASGVNNAAARVGGLLAIAALPLLVGLSGEAYEVPAQFTVAYREALLWCAGLLVAGATLAAVTQHRRARAAGAAVGAGACGPSIPAADYQPAVTRAEGVAGPA
ncbi:MAG TPA: DHA2 family efflux MFS transporter permease subunit [Pilimelia sp.]|nr:DHA2 family efflux MFS transporter permease subunit [Pilimelia sp.]